jgi:lipopolysaccharide transport system ATP-binding protein
MRQQTAPPPVAPVEEPADPPADEVVVSAHGVGKRFDIYPNDRSRFFELVGNRTHHVEHWALRGLSFQVRRGRAFGVVGSNGAGKSTLLRLLAGITEPSEGTVAVYGRMATLLDLGVGFHDTFTGRENIQLTCSLLGMHAEKIEARIPEIIRFAELGDFIDYPVRTYSTGMHMRLGFAVSTTVPADIILMDEWLSVGDSDFLIKAEKRLHDYIQKSSILVLASHSEDLISKLTNQTLRLEHQT